MTVTINGEKTETEFELLGELVRSLRDDADLVATAVNGDFVAKQMRDEYAINDGDTIDIVAPMAGG